MAPGYSNHLKRQLKAYINNTESDGLSLMESLKQTSAVEKYNLLMNVRGAVNSKRTGLFLAVNRSHMKVVGCLLKGMQYRQIYNLVKLKADNNWTSLHIAALCGSVLMMKAQLNSQPEAQKIKLIQLKSTEGDTVLHLAAASGSTEMVRYLLEDLNRQQKVDLVWLTNNNGWTAAHFAAACGKGARMTQYLLQAMTIQQRFFLLRSKTAEGDNVLHLAFHAKNTETLLAVLSPFLLETQRKLLTIPDSEGKKIAGPIPKVLCDAADSVKTANNLVKQKDAQLQHKNAQLQQIQTELQECKDRIQELEAQIPDRNSH